jgi:hydroxymethylglutaryl-CoA reductase
VTGRAVAGCFAAAVIIFAALTLTGNTRAGIALALGLVLGSINGALAERALGAGVSLRMSSVPRLAILSGAAIGGGLLLGTQYAWLVILGVAGAQVVLVAVAAGSLLKR